MSRRDRNREIEAPGQDSFLDVVANLVGILAILVVVVGMRAKGAFVEAEAPEDRVTEQQLAESKTHARAIENDIHQVSTTMARLDQSLAQKMYVRQQLQVLATAARRRLDEERNKLGESDRQRMEQENALARCEQDLQRINGRVETLQAETAPIVISHVPTPIAKTVFGREEHFRLKNGRLCYVPINEMVEKLKAEAPRKLWKLESANQITETIDPVDGFLMKYTLHVVDHLIDAPGGPIRRQGAELDHFDLIPIAEDLGEPIDEALRPGSNFQRRLTGYSPDITTITVWTYPDSYEHFRRLKSELYQKGFACAARPMADDLPISGSPDGSHSASQ